MTRVGAVFAVALLLGACGGGGGDDEEADSGDSSTETTEPAVPEGTSYYAEATTAEVQIYDAEDATQPTQSLAHPTERGVPLVFLVDGTDVEGERLPVYLPVKPNGSKGWVDASSVKLTANPYSIEVRLAEHNLKVKQGTEVIIDTPVGLGAAGAETPVGKYFIKELLQNPNPDDVYGPYAYGISAFTENPEVADQFGGDGVIGVHGNNDPSSIGQSVSHGCIRLPNDVITEMAGLLPLGTPIEIIA
jgi:lipoprotein-anchoring transpeptidase ErfK/SrfK